MLESSPADEETEVRELLDLAQAGDCEASGRLLERYRARLRTMAASRLDRRTSARIDASDIAQESLAEAARRLEPYLRDRPLPFYPWLRQIALERLIDVRRKHIQAANRSVGREASMPEGSAFSPRSLDVSPSAHLLRAEGNSQITEALNQLPESDRHVLLLRHVQGLTASQTARSLNVSEEAAKSRHRRALERLRDQLSKTMGEGSR